MASSPIPVATIQAAIAALEPHAANARRHAAVAGLDGFVDEILHVVARRDDFDSYERMTTIAEFGGRIAEAAGHSTNIEFVVQQEKIGGNGPIMANALGHLGFPLTYIGAVGKAAIHPVFQPLTAWGEVISLCEPAHTDAAEFADGKIMLGKMTTLAEITPETLERMVGPEKLRNLLSHASLLALVNWTMIPHMSGIFEHLLTHVLPKMTFAAERGRPVVFFDLADPAKRPARDLHDAVQLISRFAEFYHVILGLNEKESIQVAQVLLGEGAPRDPALIAAALRDRLKVEVVVHPTAYAVAATADGAPVVRCDGPYTAKPKITTGAGDHFNAGYSYARVLGVPAAQAVCIGKATSGFYVRTGRSPAGADLLQFLKDWSHGTLPEG